MKEYFKQKVLRLNLFTFLFFPTVIFHVFNTNIKTITYFQLLKPLLFSISFSLIIYLLFKTIIKNKNLQLLLSIEVILIFTTYGIQYNFIEQLYYGGFWPFDHIHRILLIIQLLIILFSIFIVLKLKINCLKFAKGTNLIVSFLFIYNILLFNYNFIINENNTKKYKVDYIETKNQKPNIYYFILDGYANDMILKKHFNFSNLVFINNLKKNKFEIIDSSFSNYYSTNNSISSTLNMSLFETQNIYNNKVFELFKKNNYKINIIKSGYSVTSNIKNVDLVIVPKGLNEIERTLLNLTIFRIDDVIGQSLYTRIKSQLDLIKTLPTNGNNFNFIHIVSPHPPFVFDENGNKTTNIKSMTNYWEPKTGYINQLKFISKRILFNVKQIVKKDPKSIIIIQSDHGPIISSKNIEEIFEARKYILNCIYGPEELKKQYVQTKSSVNTFIHVYNYIFNKKNKVQKELMVGKKIFLKETRINKILKE
jgi:hypothetical protein